MKKVSKRLNQLTSVQNISILIVVIAVAALGYKLLSSVHASTPYASSYAADGNLTTPATLVSGGSNANSQAVQFGTPSTTTPTTGEHIAVPSYIYPGSTWTTIDAGYPTASIAFINPDSGPGSSADPNYVSQVQASQAAGLAIYGYVWSDYGGESLSTMEAQVTDYLDWYGVTNIFFDGAATDCGTEASIYLPLYNFVHANGGKVMLNPGTATSECYMSAADIIATYEGDGADYASQTEPSWASGYAADRFFNIVYSTSAADMPSIVSHAESINVGYIYVTDAGEPNPYDVLPSYWSQELTTVAGG
jgi:hypothetical protein